TRNIVIAVGLALVAMLITLFYVANYRRSVQSDQQTVKVFVAARDLPVGTPGATVVHTLRTISVPRHAVVPGAISSPDQIGSLVLAQPLYAGDEVTLRRFTTVRAEGIRGQLTGTMRAVQVAGDANQLLAGTLQAGDHVDLVANLHSDPSVQAPATKIVLRDLLVLQAPSGPTTAIAPGTQASAIVAVTDTQVERLFYVLKNADWTFELRPTLNAVDGADRTETPTTVLHEGSR
ncbi:MAG: Flp pilus assembly protein CpaB, partial [Actinobacteria bacterium]|nr:Flp pilus assembly protein CpaB [Actinomycetota bacterium]